jgi:hypothetical protein
MSIDTLPSTKIGGLRIRNLTHYNTDDLMAIVNRVQKVFSGPAHTWSYAVEEASVEGSDKVLEIREFTGRPRSIRRHNGTAQVTAPPSTRLFLAPSRWRNPLTFRVLPPEKLHESPLQTLSESTEDNPTIPQHMVQEFADAVGYLWRQRVYSSAERATPRVSDMTIRIGAVKPKGNKKHAALARKRLLLHNETRRISYRTEQALRYVKAMQEHLQKVEIHTKAMGLDLTKVEMALASVRTALFALEPTQGLCDRIAKEAQDMVDAT